MSTEPRTLEELIAAADRCWVFPFLVEIVNKAPSAKAADNYITSSLGWGATLGRQIRNAARIAEQYPETWKGLSEVPTKSGGLYFAFLSDKMLSDFDGDLSMNSNFQLGGLASNRTNFPLLLREFKFNKSRINTFDGRPEDELRYEDEWGSPISGFSDSSKVPSGSVAKSPNFDVRLRHTTGYNSERRQNYPATEFVSNLDSGQDMFVASQNVMYSPPIEKGMPCLIKKVEITKKSEKITILLHQAERVEGFTMNEGRIGGIVYKKTIGVSPNLEITLEVEYHIDNLLRVFLNKFNHEPIKARLTARWSSVGMCTPAVPYYDTPKFFRSMKDLASIADKIHGERELVSIEKVAGISLFENPPNTLAELFY